MIVLSRGGGRGRRGEEEETTLSSETRLVLSTQDNGHCNTNGFQLMPLSLVCPWLSPPCHPSLLRLGCLTCCSGCDICKQCNNRPDATVAYVVTSCLARWYPGARVGMTFKGQSIVF